MAGVHRAQSVEFSAGRHPAVRVALALATAFLMTSSGLALAKGAPAEVAPPVQAWSMNLYDSSVVRYQNPDLNGCTAAATVSMLDLIAVAPMGDTPPPRGSSLPTNSFRWAIDISWNSLEQVMWFERKHMTMFKTDKGSDPHGWRNGLNYFGWGSMTAGIYRDTVFPTFEKAVKAVVNDLARTNKPVGVLGWAGAHAQYITGYTVQGEDPRVSDNYTILGVFLSDPLKEEDKRNTYVTYKTWKSGPPTIRFSKYMEFGSTLLDPIDKQIGDTEWRHKWVVIEPTQ